MRDVRKTDGPKGKVLTARAVQATASSGSYLDIKLSDFFNVNIPKIGTRISRAIRKFSIELGRPAVVRDLAYPADSVINDGVRIPSGLNRRNLGRTTLDYIRRTLLEPLGLDYCLNFSD